MSGLRWQRLMIAAHAPQDHHLEHQFRPPAHRSGRQVSQKRAARRALPARDQVPGRRLSAQALQAARLRARRAQRAEGLSRRRRALARCRSSASTCRASAARPTAAISRWCWASAPACAIPITLHNFYVPAGGDEPDPEINPKFQHKLDFLDEMRAHPGLRPAKVAARHPGRRSQRGAARARRLEPQADDQGGLAHADRMREAQRRAQRRRLDRQHARAHAGAGEALHLVELSRDGQLARGRPRPPARSHLDLGCARRPRLRDQDRQGLSRRRAPLRPRAGDGDGRDSDYSIVFRCAVFTLAEFARPAVDAFGHHVAQFLRRRPGSLPASCGTGCAKCGSPPSALSRSRSPGTPCR